MIERGEQLLGSTLQKGWMASEKVERKLQKEREAAEEKARKEQEEAELVARLKREEKGRIRAEGERKRKEDEEVAFTDDCARDPNACANGGCRWFELHIGIIGGQRRGRG